MPASRGRSRTTRLARGIALESTPTNSIATNTEPTERPSGVLASPLARELRGDLPCVRCKYNLKGLTVKGMCPECGISVRTTLLALVDPMAKELQPIRHPTLTSLGIVVWPMAALMAAICVWFLRGEDFLSRPQGGNPSWWLAIGAVACTALSGSAALVLIAPHERVPRWQRWSAILGVAAYVPLCVLLYYLHVRWDSSNRPPYGFQAEIVPERLVLRGCISLLYVGILLLLRPNARLLSGRWVLMRIGVVDRQTMFSMSFVVGIWCVGDALRFASIHLQGAFADVVRFTGTGIVVVGSLLFTVGLASVVAECWRLRPVLAQPPLDLDELTRDRDESALAAEPNTIPSR